MFDDTTKFEPFKSKGRTILEEGVWLFAIIDGRESLFKVDKANLEHAFKMLPFEAHHMFAAQVGAPPIFLPQMFGTYDAWMVNGAQCSQIAWVHPTLAQKLDEEVKRGLSVIIEAKAKDVPKLELVH